jgi:hypothetical protein
MAWGMLERCEPMVFRDANECAAFSMEMRVKRPCSVVARNVFMVEFGKSYLGAQRYTVRTPICILTSQYRLVKGGTRDFLHLGPQITVSCAT